MTMADRVLSPDHDVPEWIVWLVTVVAFVNLIVGGILVYYTIGQRTLNAKLQHTDRAAACWDRVLDDAVTLKQSAGKRTALIAEAQRCTRYLP